MFDLNSFQFAEPFLKSFRTRGALLYGYLLYVRETRLNTPDT